MPASDRVRARLGLALVLWAALPGWTMAADGRPSLVGKWRLNLAESELLEGEEKPAELVMNIVQDDGTRFRWTVTVRMPDGETGSTGFAGSIDGKPYPVQGKPGSTSAFKWLSDGTLKQVSESAAGIAVETCSFSANFKKMSCEARQTDTQGRMMAWYEVFDRS